MISIYLGKTQCDFFPALLACLLALLISFSYAGRLFALPETPEEASALDPAAIAEIRKRAEAAIAPEFINMLANEDMITL